MRKDGIFLQMKKRMLLLGSLLLLALALVNIAIGALNCQSTGLIKNGMLTMSWVNFFAAALLIGIDAVYAIDVLVKRRRAGGLEREE